jgi:hypothetical protein
MFFPHSCLAIGVLKIKNMMVATSRSGTAYLSTAPEFTSGFCGVHVA